MGQSNNATLESKEERLQKDLAYLKLSKFKKILFKTKKFFRGILPWLRNLLFAILNFFKKVGLGIAHECVNIVQTFIHGDWKTKVSYVIMGFGNLARGQWGRGVLFLALEVIFIIYMIFWGGNWLSQMGTLGTQGPEKIYDPIYDTYTTIYHDNSFKILLYSVLTLFFIVAVVYTWRVNIKQNQIAEAIIKSGKPLRSTKGDLHSLIDDQFHKTLLALPTIGILIFTVLPIIFMILIAFTNYSGKNNGYSNNLFTWVGWDNFNTLLNWNSGNKAYSAAFGEILAWTLIWAFFATFSNYFLGMLVAIMINKKGIKLKKVWRTILVLTIAIPQFISLLYVSKMFADNGIINGWIVRCGGEAIGWFSSDPNLARTMVIVINIWIGIPYLMLIATGILMNIPEDLYESAKIDGANVWQQYTKITLPYMLFITGPYLLTSFIGNMNNFNVIFLLTGGAPLNTAASSAAGNAGYTDLLVTWLFKITTGTDALYYMASVIGILVFVVVAFISIIVYNFMPSNKNEEDYQ